MNLEATEHHPVDPFCRSLWGEYARLFLIATAACSALAWAGKMFSSWEAAVVVAGNILVLASSAGLVLQGTQRKFILLGFTAVFCLLMVFAGSHSTWWETVPIFSPAILLASLISLAVREVLMTIESKHTDEASLSADDDSTDTVSEGSFSEGSESFVQPNPRWSYRSWALIVFGIALLMYMVVVPTVVSISDVFFAGPPTSYTLEDATLLEQLRVRSAKFAVFAIFAACGASVGSFLNVVAASAPKGESIALRTSACPVCETPIRRIDNLPIFSYLNLGGRCRACGVTIPARYFIVEVIAMGIFSLLFLTELVNGGANVPGFPRYMFTGIVWIILYTKWPVVGIYLFHAGLMCAIMTLALMDRDRLRCPQWLAWGVLIVMATLPVFVPTLQPVVFDRHLPFTLTANLPDWISRLIAIAMGLAIGWILGLTAKRFVPSRRTASLPLAFALIGVSMGWQAALVIGLIFAILLAIAFSWKPGRRFVIQNGGSAVLLIAVIVHHPFWKTIDRWW